ncbi:MAG: ABC transporter substrate-binding protein [Eggerthellaceae bacterium]|nr:ABC transporter substrate-binding protein [Eggerthellaceae bacterium]
MKKHFLKNTNKVKLGLSLFLTAPLIFSYFGLCACSGSEPANDTEYQTVIDIKEREIEVPVEVKHAIILSAAECEIAYDLSVPDRIAVLGDMCDYPSSTFEKQKVQSGSSINVEQILQLKPDVVITDTMGVTKEQINSIERHCIPVVVTEATDFCGVYRSIMLIAKVFNKQDNGNLIATKMRDKIDACWFRAKKQTHGKSIYIEVSPLQHGLWSGGKGTFLQDICDSLLLVNICEELNGWSNLGPDLVIDKNPDIIISATDPTMIGDDPVEEIKKRAGWGNINAVKNNNIYCMDISTIQRPCPRLADAVEQIYNYAYG